MRKSNIFFIRNNKIAVFRVKNNHLDLLKDRGEIFRDINENFWEWWQGKVAFLEGEDEADFCFVWDKENDIIMKHKYFCGGMISDIWGADALKELLEYFEISGKISDKNGNFVGKNAGAELYTNILIKNTVDTTDINKRKVIESSPTNENPMQQYFTELREKQKAERQ